ncbi:MAG: (2Fe-2S)-binding protein [Actinobacteria bacterium]|nr:(2Fe-2S)-binding protein [Actinomycetota bacterium]
MVVCHCRAVSDSGIRHAVERGAADVESVARHCGAGSVCGGCRPAIALLLGVVCPLDAAYADGPAATAPSVP